MKRILVILPTYNERDNIEPIIKTIFDAATRLHKTKLDILVVDSRSPDGTGQIVKKLSKAHSNLHLLLAAKDGLGKAYLRGFKYGLGVGAYDAFIMMDADFSHDPYAIPQLVQALDQGSDYVIGSRYVQGGTVPGSWPIRRIIISRVANKLARFLVGFDTISDTTGGFKAISAAALKEIDLSKLNASGYFFQVNLLHEFWSRKFKIAEVPITFVDRRFGVSKLKLIDIIEFVYMAYRINPDSRIRKLVRFVIVGACGTVVNLLALHLLVKFGGIKPQLAVIVAIELSIISNFIMNHNFTFRFQKNHSKSNKGNSIFVKLAKYNSGALGGALISYAVFTALYGGAHTQYLIADAIGIVVATSWNYWVSTKFIWKVVDTA